MDIFPAPEYSKRKDDKQLMYNSENSSTSTISSTPFSYLKYMDEEDRYHGKNQPTLLNLVKNIIQLKIEYFNEKV